MRLSGQAANTLGMQCIFGNEPLPTDYLAYAKEQAEKGNIPRPRMIHLASPFSPSAVLATFEFEDDSTMHVLPGAFVDADALLR